MQDPARTRPLLGALLCFMLADLGCSLDAGTPAQAAAPKDKDGQDASNTKDGDSSNKGSDADKGDEASAETDPATKGEDEENARRDAESDEAETNRAAEDQADGLQRRNDDELGAYRDDEGQRPKAVDRSERELLTALKSRSESLASDRLALARRDAELQNIQAELKERLSKISELEERLQVQLGIGRAAKDRRAERVTALSELIIKMPPQSGAEIMAQMTDEDAQAILLSIARKESRKAAQILAQMPATRAAQLGEQYLNTELKLPGSEDLVPKDANGKAKEKAGGK